MFQKKDIIYSETMGVCKVDDITKLVNAKGQGGMYYVLRAKYEKGKVSYIPVEEHQVVLRNLISSEEAHTRIDNATYDKENFLECGEIAHVLGLEASALMKTEA